jgi:hypothetical protein
MPTNTLGIEAGGGSLGTDRATPGLGNPIAIESERIFPFPQTGMSGLKPNRNQMPFKKGQWKMAQN